jgi:CheY-like chemotaxis protein
MAQILEDLLDVARVSAGKMMLRKESVDLATVLGRAVEGVRASAEKVHQELRVTVPPPPTVLEADPARLEQVFTNLLTNAVKYTPARGRIEVMATQGPHELVVRVKDTGIGLSADALPHVFELFTQVDDSHKTRGGLGIGLALVRHLMELHGGRVEAFSEGLGKGSEFVVHLPAEPGAVKNAQAPRKSAPPQPLAVPARRLLLVDDNRDSAETMAGLLRSAGHQVRVASDGTSALKAAAEQPPEAVLLDIGLPGMDGYEVAQRLRRVPGLQKVLLVAVTGYGQQEDRVHSKDAGFDHHLVKPIDMGELQRILGEVREKE